jgi:isoleucyl-tRNA synthetase
MSEQPPRSYPSVDVVTSPADYPELELETLGFWEADGTFEASIEQRKDAAEYVFYDGPPFANGLPHYGHLLTGFVKDAVPRYKTMRGLRVDRRFGWDCHGLPAETEAEKELGVSGRGPITEYGIDRFNEFCRTSVLRYTEGWKRYVGRQARWVDFEHGYKTMDPDFMESVMWAFAELNRKGLIYEGYRVLPYCWECETPLSNFETRQDDAYRERIDPAVTVAFALRADAAAPELLAGDVSLLVWTTTPWTLPSNLALAVGEDLTYACYLLHGRTVVLAEARVAEYADELEGAELLGTVTGAALVGRSYVPLFPYFADAPNAFRVLSADFVTTEDGTGIVHMAPGFGEDDQRVCEAAGIDVICPVDDRANFDARVADFAGLQVFEANAPITRALRESGVLFREERYSHSYPHCWRTDTPLIYRAVSSYFVEVSAIKDRLLANNQQINWVPEYMKDGAFGKWLEGARDWSISRNRFWGAPIPVWKSDDPAYPRTDVYGSIAELVADFGVEVPDLHRPFIDGLVRPNPDDPTGKSMMRRVSDVLDCWFESGSMPFAQLHYPFENKTWFEDHFPADFICEYVGQTRGWFYTLHVLATALFDRPAFANCLAHGNVLGDDGRKLSKRLRNFPDPEEFFGHAGADAMRWYMLSSPVLRGLDVAMESDAMAEPIRRVLNPIWNSWYFLCLYAGSDKTVGVVRTDQRGLLDRYILAKTAALADEVGAAMDDYDLSGSAAAITSYLDALTNWYVRRSRDRFWRPFGESEASDADKHDAYDTLHTVLEVLCRVAAPLLPFLAEEVWRPLTGERSVHLTWWPGADELPSDTELVASMDLVREICSAAHSIRKASGLRARLPLRSLTFAGPGSDRLSGLAELIKDEVNVKEVRFSDDVAAVSNERLSLIPAKLGPRLGSRTQEAIAAVRTGAWHRDDDGAVIAGDIVLREGEYELLAVAADEQSARVLSNAAGVVVLDREPDEELEAEGTARDIVRSVQEERKRTGLRISDRIRLTLALSDDVATTVEDHLEWISAQTLALEIEVIALNGAEAKHELSDGTPIGIYLSAL